MDSLMQISGYKIESKVGQGGMAMVYRATQESDFLKEVTDLASGEGRLATESVDCFGTAWASTSPRRYSCFGRLPSST